MPCNKFLWHLVSTSAFTLNKNKQFKRWKVPICQMSIHLFFSFNILTCYASPYWSIVNPEGDHAFTGNNSRKLHRFFASWKRTTVWFDGLHRDCEDVEHGGDDAGQGAHDHVDGAGAVHHPSSVVLLIVVVQRHIMQD